MRLRSFDSIRKFDVFSGDSKKTALFNAFLTKRDYELIDPIMIERFHDVLVNCHSDNLNHWFRFVSGLFTQPRVQSFVNYYRSQNLNPGTSNLPFFEHLR